MVLGFFLVTRVNSLDDDFSLPFMQWLNNIGFSVIIKDEMLEILSNYLMNVYQSNIISSILRNAINIADSFLSFSYRNTCGLW